MDCFIVSLVFLGFGLAAAALIRSSRLASNYRELQTAHQWHTKRVAELEKRLGTMERAMAKMQAPPPVAAAPTPAAPQPVASQPVAPPPEALKTLEMPLPVLVPPATESALPTSVVASPLPESNPQLELPEPDVIGLPEAPVTVPAAITDALGADTLGLEDVFLETVPMASLESTLVEGTQTVSAPAEPVGHAELAEAPKAPEPPEAAKPQVLPPPAPQPAAPAEATPRPQPARPEASRPQPPPRRPPAPRVEPARRAPAAPSRTLEDLLGTQVFLKLGIAILVIGIVFIMSLAFQQVGAGGKVAMGYAGGLALLAGGWYAEQRERYRTFGRALIAGAWGILYFVTYAAGFIEAARVFDSKVVAVVCLILAAASSVAFSLRYRNEWTTTSAFLLIFLSLGISATEVQPAFNLVATLIVAFSMAILIWRTGWVRLLGLGIPATWGSLALWSFTRMEGAPGIWLPLGFAGAWLAFQLATLGDKDEPSRRSWQAFAQIGNFMGALGLTLWLLVRAHDVAWGWALAYGLVHLPVAWVQFRRGSRGLYLLTATQAIAALALVTPLRLGMDHALTPVLRLIGIQLVLAAGVFLKDRYFRVLAYGAYGLTVLEILVFKLGSAHGDQRLVLLGAACAFALLNAALVRTWWRSACESESPALANVFTGVGTFLWVLFAGFRFSQPWLGVALAATSAGWLILGRLRALKDLLVEGVVLGSIALLCLVHGATTFSGPGTFALWGALFLVLAYAGFRSGRGRTLDETWVRRVSGISGLLMTLGMGVLVVRECPPAVVPPALGGMALLWLLLGLTLGFRELIHLSLLSVAGASLTLETHAWAQRAETHRLAERTWSVLGVALAAMGMEALFRRTWRNPVLADSERGAGLWGMAALGTAGLVTAVVLEASSLWIVPILSVLALLLLIRALALHHKEHAALATCVGAAALVAVFTHTWHDPGRVGAVTLRSFGLMVAAAGFMLQEGLLYKARQRWPLSMGAWSGLVLVLCHGATALLVMVIFLELPSAWIAPLLSAFSMAHLLLGLGQRQKNHVVASLWVSTTVLLALWNTSFHVLDRFAGLPLRVWSMGLPALGFLLKEVLLRRWKDRWPWDEGSGFLFSQIHGVLGAILIGVIVLLDVPRAWVAPAYMALGVIWMSWGRWRASALHVVESLAFVATGFVTLASHAWFLTGALGGVPVRILSILGALLLAYLVLYLLERARFERHSDRVVLADHLSPGTLAAMILPLLMVTSLVAGTWIKLEALAHGKNLLVTLAWSVIGVLYLERGRVSKGWHWVWHGHLWLLAGLVHFLAVNLLQPGELGFVSLRLATGLPFLGFMAYAYLLWPELDRIAEAPLSAAKWRQVYLYGGQLALAMILLYEPHRAAVLPLWSIHALASLAWGLKKENPHWLRSAVILAVACGVRGIGVNLNVRDLYAGWSLNLLTVPLASAILLVGYILLRRRLEGPATLDLKGLGAGIHRLPWLVLHAVLMVGFIWIEASGTQLTVWLSAYGLAMVSLGFIFGERVARLSGLGILSFCILKLFIFDLRGLKGLARGVSFVVLGGVLVVVSYVYARFRERLEKFL